MTAVARWRVRCWVRLANLARALGWHAATPPAELRLRNAYDRLVDLEARTPR